MTTILPIIQIVIAALLMITILLQQSEAGLGGAFGGSDVDGVHHTRRGFEKFLYISSIVLAVLFAASAIILVIVG